MGRKFVDNRGTYGIAPISGSGNLAAKCMLVLGATESHVDTDRLRASVVEARDDEWITAPAIKHSGAKLAELAIAVHPHD